MATLRLLCTACVGPLRTVLTHRWLVILPLFTLRLPHSNTPLTWDGAVGSRTRCWMDAPRGDSPPHACDSYHTPTCACPLTLPLPATTRCLTAGAHHPLHTIAVTTHAPALHTTAALRLRLRTFWLKTTTAYHTGWFYWLLRTPVPRFLLFPTRLPDAYCAVHLLLAWLVIHGCTTPPHRAFGLANTRWTTPGLVYRTTAGPAPHTTTAYHTLSCRAPTPTVYPPCATARLPALPCPAHIPGYHATGWFSTYRASLHTLRGYLPLFHHHFAGRVLPRFTGVTTHATTT